MGSQWGAGERKRGKSAARWREGAGEGEEASTELNQEPCGPRSLRSAEFGQISVEATDLISTLEASLLFAPPSVFTVNSVTDTIAIVED